MSRVTDIALAPGADANGLAVMLSELLRQNLESNPKKLQDFDAIRGVVAIVATDAEVALTLCFDPTHQGGALRIHDGLLGVPDLVIRATSDIIIALSNLPDYHGLPIPRRGDDEGKALVKEVLAALRGGTFRIEGVLRHLPMMSRFSRLMSVR